MLKAPSFLGKTEVPPAQRDIRPVPAPQPALNTVKPVAAEAKPDTATEAANSTANAATSTTPPTTGNRLIVGPDVKLKGAEIHDCDTLVVEGRVEATMDSRIIRIAEDGEFSGTVGIDTAEIHGKFEGELTARQHLIIHSTGKVVGKIRYGKILIEEGGQLSGDIQSIAGADVTYSTTLGPALQAKVAAGGMA